MREGPDDPGAISGDAARLAADLIDQISHDLRSPVGAILLWVRILRQAAAGAEVSGAADMIDRSAAGIAAQLRALDDMRATLLGDKEPHREPVDFGALVAASAHARGDDAAGQEVSIHAPEAAGPVVVTADPARLRQAIDCLLGGLLRDAPRGGRLDIRMEASDAGSLCRVEVSGPPPALPAHVSTALPAHVSTALPAHAPQRGGLRIRLAGRIIELQGGCLRREGGRGVAYTVEFTAGAGAGNAT